MLLPLSSCLQLFIYSPENTLVQFLVRFYFFLIFLFYHLINNQSQQLSAWHGRLQMYKGCRLKSLQNFSYDSQMFACTLYSVQYSVYPLVITNGLWLSGLSCLFLLQNNWPMQQVVHRFKSFPRLLFLYLYSVYTNKKLSHPLFPIICIHMQLPHLVKSAALPKTTSLCGSITVITL